MNKYISKFNKNDKILKITYHSIFDYYNWHKEKQIKMKCPYIEKYLKKYSYFKEDYDKKKLEVLKQ